MCALSRTSRQCAIGCELKVSSMIAVSTLMFAASFAGSANRGSFKRSARPIPAARAGILSGVATRTNQMLSELLYTFIAAFAGFFRSCCGANYAPASAALIATPADQTPAAKSEVVTEEPLPVRSRRYRAVTIAANNPTPDGASPVPANGQVGGAPASCKSESKPVRDQ